MKTIIFKLAIFLSVSALLTGCASIYTSPQTGPKAQLGVLDQQMFANGNYIGIFDDPITCKGFHLLGGLKQRINGTSITITANKLTTIVNNHNTIGYDPTDFTVTFYPHANEKYFISTEHSKINDDSMYVYLRIVKEVKGQHGARKYTPVRMVKRTLQRDKLTGFDTVCTDQEVQKKLRTANLSD